MLCKRRAQSVEEGGSAGGASTTTAQILRAIRPWRDVQPTTPPPCAHDLEKIIWKAAVLERQGVIKAPAQSLTISFRRQRHGHARCSRR